MESALKPVLTNLEKIQKADTYKSEDKEYQNIGNKAGKYVEAIWKVRLTKKYLNSSKGR